MRNPIIDGQNVILKHGRSGPQRNVGEEPATIQVSRNRTGTVILSIHKKNRQQPVVLIMPPETARLLGEALTDPECGKLIV